MALVSPLPDEPSAAEVLRARYTSRLPEHLTDLAGPAHGTVALPLHVVWSGLRSFDLDRPRSRMSLYRTVLAEGQREDLTAFLHSDLLLAQWPVLRTLISRTIRDVWESRFTDLAARASIAA
ncbi:hypothetical protein ACGFSB_34595 [Streptomyces sp. NPDC048441]|uniref:hypothetical protein n=1 Tax=Streptomyces sp. NPDC048441 TaxID=3365552 RepID=UPI00370FAA03